MRCECDRSAWIWAIRVNCKSKLRVSRVKDTVRATLRNALTVDRLEVRPAGTELTGHVTEAERAGRVKGRARLEFQFTSLRYDGERRSLRTAHCAGSRSDEG